MYTWVLLATPSGSYHSRKKYYMQSLFPQELILDYRYSRGVRRNYFPIAVSAAVAARNYFPIAVTVVPPRGINTVLQFAVLSSLE